MFAVARLPEGSAVKGGRQRHDGVDDGQQAEEEDEQQQAHVEVVGLGGLEDPLVWNVGGHDGPALIIHGAEQAQHVDPNQARSIESTHPESRWTRGDGRLELRRQTSENGPCERCCRSSLYQIIPWLKTSPSTFPLMSNSP